MAYLGDIICSKCYKQYRGLDHRGNLCNECFKEKEEKSKALALLLHNKFKDHPDKVDLLFDFLLNKFENEMTGYLIKVFDIKIEHEDIVFK